MRKNNKKRKISLFKIIAFLLSIVTVFLAINVFRLDVLPIKYSIVFALILILLNVLCDWFLMRKKAKTIFRVFFSFIAIITIVLFSIISCYISGTLGFLENILDESYKIENYSVIVLKDSHYQELKDIKGLKMGYASNSVGIKTAKKKLLKKVDVEFKEYSDSTTLANDLLSKEIDVIAIEDSLLSMIKEDNPDFENDTRIIYQFSIRIKASTSAKDVNVVKEPFNIYLSGIDTYGKIESVSRSDVNMVVTVNPKTKQILLTSIPRDYYVKLHGIGAEDKLTHAGMYGIDMSIATIEDLLDIEINYYLKVNFTSLIDVVNSLGGINVYSDYTFTSIDNFSYAKGNNSMNGEQALSFARERKAFAAGDRQRVKNQQAVITAIIKKACSKSILTKYDSLLKSLSNDFQTNMSTKKITSLIKMQLNDMSSWNISTYSLEGADSRNYTYTGGNYLLYVMEPVSGSVEEAHSLISKVISGEKLDANYEYDGPINSVEKSTASNNSNITEQKDKITSNKNDSDKTKNSINFSYPNCKDVLNGYCLESTNPIYTCSDGYKLDENNSCVFDSVEVIGTVPIIDPTLTCSEGYELNSSNICQKQLEIKVCDNGYEYDSAYKICCPIGYSYSEKSNMCEET